MRKEIIPRLLPFTDRSFFLFGPRGVGKSTWLKQQVKAVIFDLLRTDLFLELSRNPVILEAKIGDLPKNSWIIIDEIQKIPALLNEVHRLIEDRGWKFALSGSSARKLRSGGVNLLGGRAVTRHLAQFSYKELGNRFNLKQALEWGTLPFVVQNPRDSAEILNSYTQTYIKEEIKEEGIVRKLDPFLRFIEIAGIVNGQQINAGGIARDASVPRSNVDIYFSILIDTLIGHWLPAYRPNVKVREQNHPKFYWFDAGVARGAAGLLFDPVDAVWLGRSLETLIFHELRVYNHVSGRNRNIAYYKTGSAAEIDFIIETQKRRQASSAGVICIEVKYSKKWDRKWEKPARELKASGKIRVDGMIGVYTGDEKYIFNDFKVFPVLDFLSLLHEGKIF